MYIYEPKSTCCHIDFYEIENKNCLSCHFKISGMKGQMSEKQVKRSIKNIC